MTAAPQRPSLDEILRSHTHVAEYVDRDARDEADDAAAWIVVGQDVSGWWVMEYRWYRRDYSYPCDPDTAPRPVVAGVSREQALRCASNLAEHIRAVWADAEAERYGCGGCVSRRAS